MNQSSVSVSVACSFLMRARHSVPVGPSRSAYACSTHSTCASALLRSAWNGSCAAATRAMSRSARKVGRMLPAKHRCRFGNGFAVVARLRSAEVHAAAVAHHRLAVAEDAAARRNDLHLVAERFELATRFLRHELFDV